MRGERAFNFKARVQSPSDRARLQVDLRAYKRVMAECPGSWDQSVPLSSRTAALKMQLLRCGAVPGMARSDSDPAGQGRRTDVIAALSRSVMKSLIALGTCLALTSCSSSTAADNRPTAPPTPSQTKSSGISESSTLNCADWTGTGSLEGNGLTIVAGVVTLPVAATFGPVQANPNPEGTHTRGSVTRFYAKQPLAIRTGRTFDLIVPPGERDRLAIDWGNSPGNYTERLHVACPTNTTNAKAQWLIFAGGYFAPRRRCSSLIVRTDGQDHHVRIGVGARCR